MKNYNLIKRTGIITKNGLLYIPLETFQADSVARLLGYNWAEELVKDLKLQEKANKESIGCYSCGGRVVVCSITVSCNDHHIEEIQHGSKRFDDLLVNLIETKQAIEDQKMADYFTKGEGRT